MEVSALTPRARRARPTLRSGLIAWALATVLLVIFSANPYAATASALQLHGALMRDESMGIVSHRGAAALAPENTLEAMGIAIEQGVEFVETDLQLTADGVPVLMHDDTLDRTTNAVGRVGDRTLEEIKGLDAGSWYSKAYAGALVPTFEEFLDLLSPSTTRALVELKGVWSVEEAEPVVAQLRARHMENRVALQSFEPETLEMLLEAAPEYARVLLTREWDRRTVAQARELRVSAVGARTKLYDARPELLEDLRAVGIGAMVYTLNTEKRWKQARHRGVDFVITDDPVGFAEWRDADAVADVRS